MSKKSSKTDLPVLPELRETRFKPKTFKPLNKSQEQYVNKINNNIVTFAIGPAGTGKTYVAAMAAAEAFKNKEVERIIITRPLVEAGEKLGFLPGDLNEKVDPYVAPVVEALSRIMGSGQVEALIEHGKIIFLPLAFLRGHSFNNTFVIADEMQNASKTQMKLFLTRIGKGTKVIIDGDLEQRDLEVNGLDDALERVAKISGIAIHVFTEDDVVRSGIVKDILRAYASDNFTTPEDREGLSRYLNKG